MARGFQDDVREDAMIKLFELHKADSEGRAGIDAFLNIGEMSIPFELKTTSTGSVTTVRDFGHDHIAKWKNKHWLFGFFVGGRTYYKYGSPTMMENWIRSMEAYIAPDIKIAQLVRSKLNLIDLFDVLGEKQFYSIEDAKSLHKRQYNLAQYYAQQDLQSGYTQERMLEILKDRAQYLVARGSTLNNPHIPFGYFSDWFEITENHPEVLRALVLKYLTEPTEDECLN